MPIANGNMNYSEHRWIQTLWEKSRNSLEPLYCTTRFLSDVPSTIAFIIIQICYTVTFDRKDVSSQEQMFRYLEGLKDTSLCPISASQLSESASLPLCHKSGFLDSFFHQGHWNPKDPRHVMSKRKLNSVSEGRGKIRKTETTLDEPNSGRLEMDGADVRYIPNVRLQLCSGLSIWIIL